MCEILTFRDEKFIKTFKESPYMLKKVKSDFVERLKWTDIEGRETTIKPKNIFPKFWDSPRVNEA